MQRRSFLRGATGAGIAAAAPLPPLVDSATAGTLAAEAGIDPVAQLGTIAELRLAPADFASVNLVQGYHRPGDGGGGYYQFDPTDTTSADNGGTIIVDPYGGRWKLLTFGLPLSVRQFGARGDGATDDRAAIQAAVDAAEGTVFFPAGRYFVAGPLTPRNDLRYAGAYGWGPHGGTSGSMLVGPPGGAIFEFVGLDNALFEALAFNAPQGYAFRQTDLAGAYISNVRWMWCDFWRDTAECIFGNLTNCDIRHNTFGYHGNPTGSPPRHRHIYAKGNATGLTSNLNRLENNRFYGSEGESAIYMETGFHVVIRGNNIERNNNTRAPVQLRGMYCVYVENNWFEYNGGASLLLLTTNPEGASSVYVSVVAQNFFAVPRPENTHLIELGGAASTKFVDNAGTHGWDGRHITRQFDAFNAGLVAADYNSIGGLIKP